MDSRKTAWIWAGLALTTGVGVVLAVSSASSASSPSEPSPQALPSPGTPPPAPTPVPPRQPRVKAGDRLLLVGDSLAVGLTRPMQQLCKGARVGCSAVAKEGTTILAWASTAFPEADITLVSLGTNDMKMMDPLSERPKLDAMLARLKKTSKRVVWIMPPPMPFPDKGVLAMLADAASKAGIEVFPSTEVPRSPDKIHPTTAGYAAWAGLIWRWIQ